ncbi:MAG TPA: carboxylesterase family protein [Myxococcota bacterium]|nr:carboxylesterase family protein [Myxococcota bacterium]
MSAPRVTTSLGIVRGVAIDGVEAFLGIRYAAPPVGALRFEPPQPAPSWRGVRDATAHGLAPIQPRDPLSAQLGLLADHAQSEDCLTLNVWRPAAPSHAPRAVMVWIHGGAFASGTAAGPAYQGAALARRGDVIVVTLNYRVGALGFLQLGAGRTNLGLLDQIAALHFVRREIAAFGGDAAHVCMFGESAGAGSIVALLAMPAARGLFSRAIVQSAAPAGMLSADEGAARAKQLGERLGGDVADLAWLRSLSAERIVEAQSRCAEPGPRRIGMFFAPIVDGAALPEWPMAAIARGCARGVDLIIGTTSEEMRLFQLLPSLAAPPDAAFVGFIASKLPGASDARAAAAQRILDAYAGLPTLARFLALETDASLFVPSAQLAADHARIHPNTRMYTFTWRSPLRGGALGACHALDVPFALGTHAATRELRDFSGSGPAATQLSNAMMDAWAAFARSGDPSHPGIGEWPRYTAEQRATQELGAECRLVCAPNEPRRQRWAAALYGET